MDNEPNFIPHTKKVIILGGGLAGLSTARQLLDRHYEVTLIEKRPFLGGRAYSFQSTKNDAEIDNGQHVFLGCCPYYIDFLKSIGSFKSTYLPKSLEAEVILDGVSGILSSTRILGLLHMLPSLISYPHLGVRDKLLVAYGMLKAKLAKLGPSLDEESAYSWLKRHHQTDRAIDNLWNLFILPSLNDDVRNVSADMALMVFREALLSHPSNSAIGLPRIGLTELNGEPTARMLSGKGGILLAGKPVKSINMVSGRVSGVQLSSGEILCADAYVSALPFNNLKEILPKRIAKSTFFSMGADLDYAPIVGIHLWYDRQVMEQTFVAVLNNPIQWVFNKSLIQKSDVMSGQYICVSLSGTWQYIDTPKEKLIEIFTQEIAKLFPRANGATIERSFVVKEPYATFRSTPGANKYRPPQKTPVANLFLAGDWTQSGWPSTMEGAIRSGVLAAEAVAIDFASSN